MPYPLSSDVISGDPTSYLHYNNLRADALRFSQAAADAVNLGTAMSRFMNHVVIEPLATNRLRVPYQAHMPPTIMIDGYLCQATADVDLAALAFGGGAATWYIFANRTAGSTTFTLSVNTSATEAANQRRIGLVYWDGAAVVYPSLMLYPIGRPAVYYALARRAAAQSINNTTWTAVSYDTEDADTDSMYTTGTPDRITIVHPGLYLIAAHAVFATAGAYTGVAALSITGTNIAYISAPGTAAISPYLSISAIRYLQAADYIRCQLYHNQGAAVNTAAPTTLIVAALSG